MSFALISRSTVHVVPYSQTVLPSCTRTGSEKKNQKHRLFRWSSHHQQQRQQVFQSPVTDRTVFWKRLAGATAAARSARRGAAALKEIPLRDQEKEGVSSATLSSSPWFISFLGRHLNLLAPGCSREGAARRSFIVCRAGGRLTDVVPSRSEQQRCPPPCAGGGRFPSRRRVRPV